MKNIIAIDPGSGGGIAVRRQDGTVVAFNMPQTDGDIINLFKEELAVSPPSANVVFLEDIVKHMGPGTPASTMAVYASNWGMIKGIVMAMGFRLQIIGPKTWQKGLNLGNIGRLALPQAPRGSTKKEKQAFKDANAFEIKKIQDFNDLKKREWKQKLRAEAQRLCPQIMMNLKKADAVLIMEYGTRITDLKGAESV